MRFGWVVLVLVAACVESETKDCGDGVQCPFDAECRRLTNPDAPYCATEEQLDACSGAEEGAACTVESGLPSSCHDGVCLSNLCGNSRLDFDEVCDEGDLDDGDGCSATCVSTETCGNGVVDLVNDEVCDDGSLASGDGCSSDCRLEVLVWERVDDTQPTGLEGPALAYDSIRDRIVMFGGRDANVFARDTFEWDHGAWYRITPLVIPPGRMHAAMAFDAANAQTVMFGGQSQNDDKSALGDTWVWDGRRWSGVIPATSPAPRTLASMVYDGRRKKVVMFGGDMNESATDEMWEWDGTNWTQIPKSAPWPGARVGAVMVYDPKRGKIVLAAGVVNDGGQPPRDTWEYDGTAWAPIAAPTPPEIDLGAGAAFDVTTNRVIVYGGQLGSTISSETFAYNGSQWVDLNRPAPGARGAVGLVGDPVRGELLLYGGVTDDNGTLAQTNAYLWDGSAWSQEPNIPIRFAVGNAAFARDPLTGVSWQFGGEYDSFGPGNESDRLYFFNGRRWIDRSQFGPSARKKAAMAFDAARGQLVLFGGSFDNTGNDEMRPNQTWLFDGAWSTATPSTSPPAREAAAMGYDPIRKRVVMFGGGLGNANFVDETWEWDGTTWHAMSPTTKPDARAGASLVYDDVNQRMLLLGGASFTPPATLTTPSTVWAWDGTNWTLLPGNAPSPGRFFGTMVYQPLRQRPITYGGGNLSGSLDDVWELDGDTWNRLILQGLAGTRAGAVGMLAPEGADIVVDGGFLDAGGAALSDSWRLRYSNASPRENCEVTMDNDRDGLSGCADPDCWAVCTPLCAPGIETCAADAPTCGDNTCSALENCHICPDDCSCSPVCGDNFCDPGETGCPGDC